ncbi:Zinc finger protein [Lachnellula hyalina]|uniref:Zinc finger protein n=1 Tax=Lachnellula hyalina TaxID=1316788 RepID=A0A8H8R4A9_9HELO|nr:Zinc finger protein [Lachnellula hyalina]TVY27781.1 Zinc finger protein [Lachnellula hyalina]
MAECSNGDALRRHEQVHQDPKRSVLEKGARACIQCALARRKCTGGTTCSGCGKRGLECSYPDANRSRRGTPRTPGQYEHSSSPVRVGQDTASYEDSPMTYSTSASPKDQSQGRFQSSAHDGGRGFTAAYDLSSANPPPLRDFNPRTAEATQAQRPSMSQDVRLEVHNFKEPSSLPRDFARPVGLQPNSAQLQTNAFIETQSERGISDRWYESNNSSLNWLPYDWTPDFQVGLGNTFGSPDEMQSPGPGRNNQNTSLDFGRVVDPASIQHETSLGSLHLNNHALTKSGDSQEVSSPGSLCTQDAGHYYVNGGGARLPRVRKAPYSTGLILSNDSRDLNTGFCFPDSDEYLHLDINTSSLRPLPLHIYDEISEIFSLTCIASNHYSGFSSSSFPPLPLFNHFIQLYFDNFQSILPFTHPPTFDLSTSHWLLILALAAVGSHYLDVEDSRIYSAPIHEFLRRAIQTVEESGGDHKPNLLILTQAKVLNSVGTMYSSDQHLTSTAKSYHGALVSFCNTEWNNSKSLTEEEVNNTGISVEDKWRTWYEGEICRRTGYCIWLLDCMWAFHFQTCPLLSLEDARAPIPCQEVLWGAKSALDWYQLYSCSTPSPSLSSAIQLAYIEKRVQSSTGEFSRILCIHALFHRTWEVENYFTQPLTLWDPTADRQDVQMIDRGNPVWLPDIQAYSKWRNSACDCLDILHWHANSVIGAASGMEHTTVLHLHLARVILLTPFRKIVQLARLITHEPTNSHGDEISSLTKDIKRWATEDQYKARLAIIHAGVLFWHIRRYSVDAFYEPSSVFLATLILWAYGRFAVHTSGINTNHNSENTEVTRDRDEDDAGLLFPTSMQLDRPADDELVQLFVKRGLTMKANIMGVGNLCSKRGYIKVLVEGRNLLARSRGWGAARRAIRTLDVLAETYQ